MGLAQRVRSFFSRSEKRSSSSKYGTFSRWFEPYSIFSRMQYGTLATNETVFSAVSRLSNSLASLPLKVYKDFVPQKTRIAALLGNSPNPDMTSFDFIRRMEAYRNSAGNGYAIKQYDMFYQVEALHILDPSRVKPVIESESRELYYEIRGDKGTYYVHNMDMIHVKHVHTTGDEGISPLKVLRNTLDYDSQVKQFSISAMASGIKASFVLKLAGQLNDEAMQLAHKQFVDFYSQDGSSVIVLGPQQSLEEVKQEIIDTKVFEVEKITIKRVASVFHMAAYMLGEMEGVSFSSMEQMLLEFVMFTMAPIVRQYEQEFDRKLLTEAERQQGMAFKFNLNALLRGDIRTRGEFYFKGIRTGFLTPNEVRAWEELPPLAGGEKLYMSRDLSPIDSPDRKEVTKK